MKIGSLEKLFAAAVAAALALPAFAQDNQSAAGQTGGARSSQAGQNDEASGAGQPGGNQAGATGRSAGRAAAAGGASSATEGGLNQDASDDFGARTANFPPQGEEGRGQSGGQGQGQRGQLNDQGLVRWIAAGNEAEIRVNEFAQQQAQNDQVKQFAQRMVQEHTMLGQQLQQAAGQGGQGGQGGASGQGGADGQSGTSDASGQNRANRRNANSAAGGADDQSGNASGQSDNASGGNRRNRAGGAGGAGGADDQATGESGASGRSAAGGGRGGNSPFLALHEEIKRQCAESTIQALREKQGAEFDHAFMHQQVVEHMTMIDTLTVAEQHASQNLKQALQQARQHAEQHLQQAKQIVEQLDKEGQRQ